MAWLEPFLLGRPGLEYEFDVPPDAMDIEEVQYAASMRTLSGARFKRVFSTSVPTIKLDSAYFPMAQRQLIASLLSVTDTPLSFRCRDDWTMTLEYNVPNSVTSIPVQQNSATRLSYYVATATAYGAGAYGSGPYGGSSIPGTVTITGVFVSADQDNPGQNYYIDGSSYNDLTYTITLAGAGVPAGTTAVYVTYTYQGWLVNLDRIPYRAAGGRVDLLSYSYSLTGA